MNGFRLDVDKQIAFGLVLGLFAGLALNGFALPQNGQPAAPTPVVEATSTLRPFVTLPGVWYVRATIHQHASPEIDEIKRYEQGRITPGVEGKGSVRLLDGSGNELYSLPFRVVFISGDPPIQVESRKLMFLLPIIQGAQRIEITMPQGSAAQPIPGGDQ